MQLLEMDKNTPLAVSFSGGKDSTATVKLLHEHGFNNVTCVYAHFYYDKSRNIPAILPDHENFIMNTLKNVIENIYHYKFIVVEPDIDFITEFNRTVSRGKNIGKLVGFPISVPKSRCWVNGRLKVKAIQKASEIIGDMIEVIGLAYDEQDRVKRIIDNEKKFSILNELHITEQMALNICKTHKILSPLYNTATRDGCWFCPNLTPIESQYLLKNHPELIKEIYELEKSTDGKRIDNNFFAFISSKAYNAKGFYTRTYKRKDNMLTIGEINEMWNDIEKGVTK